ncbi:uncharacterized protein LOC143276385 [Babylonia areolata]|uniref:uncharacterized protein LOC143276385 n=1 Tax=Babylonia areolata TaxID=304850 RepID=UPI003FD3E07D
MADYHVRHRMPSSGSDDFEDESLDPRIQVELEKLNKASEEINRLELELDDARASFRQTLSESTQKLDVLAKKLGSCVEKARPYYDARVKAKEAHLETQRAALRFERACSMHEAAKEMVQLAEQGYLRREQPSDPAWQEMLNHATMKVNEAEKERNESEQEHERTMIRFKQSEDTVQCLQKDLKRAITKSKPYFEMKARFNQIMEEHKHKVSVLEEDVGSAKSLYSTALRSLEAISDEIHRQRLERRQQQQLGVRGAGVGAECPLPPPSWEKGLEGRGSYQSLDPLGVIKIPSSASTAAASSSYGGPPPSSTRRRNLSGESAHGQEVEEESRGSPPLAGESGHGKEEEEKGERARVCGEEVVVVAQHAGTEEGVGREGGVAPPHNGSSPATSPRETVMIPGDPLGVIPPVFTRSSRLPHPPSSSSSSITHPAFAGRPAQPFQGAAGTPPSVGTTTRTKSVTSVMEPFVSPSLLYSNPDHARRPSYRRAVEASQMSAGGEEGEETYQEGEEVEGEGGVREVFESRQRSFSSPVPPGDTPRTRSPPLAIPPPSPGHHHHQGDWALADGRRHGSAPEHTTPAFSTEQGGGGGSEGGGIGLGEAMRRRQKLQGLILRVDPSMDPLRHLEPQPPATTTTTTTARKASQQAPAPSPSTTTSTSTEGERDAVTPTPPTPVRPAPQPSSSVSDPALCSQPIIRSASTVSYAGSERSETSELSELDSVSANPSPTKPPPRARLLNVPASLDTCEDSSDTESLASTGPMLDDEQVEFLTLDFSAADTMPPPPPPPSQPPALNRNSWSRMSLPPRLSYLEGFLARQAKRASGEFDSSSPSPPSPSSSSPVHCAERLPPAEEVGRMEEGEEEGVPECVGVEGGSATDRDETQEAGLLSASIAVDGAESEGEAGDRTLVGTAEGV